MEDKVKLYLIKCNRVQCRYLGFNNKSNIKNNSNIIYTGQTDPGNKLTALYFDDMESAYAAMDSYAATGKMNPKYINSMTLDFVNFSKDELNNLVPIFTDLDCEAYIFKDAYNKYYH